MNIICFFKMLYRTLSSSWFFEGIYIDGHDWVEVEDKLFCEVCGKENKHAPRL
jgi:formate dehydrogenase maturation protein FdhE